MLLKIASCNINGIKSKGKYRYVKFLLRKYDIVCLQETHSTPTTALQIERDILPLGQRSHSLFWAHAPNARKGVLVACRHSPHYAVAPDATKHLDPEGRFVNISLTITALAKTFSLLALYAPAHSDAARNDFFQSLPITSNTILVGDFNMVLDPLQDKFSSSMFHGPERSRSTLRELMDQHNLLDVWRTLNPDSDRFTYNRSEHAARLDRILIPEELFDRSVDADILVTKIPDHYPVTLTLNLNTVKKGNDRYFMNVSLLRNETFMAGFENFLNTLITTYPFPYDQHRAIIEWWEFLKGQVLNHFLIFSPLYSKLRKTKLSCLQEQDVLLTAHLKADPSNILLVEERQLNKSALAAAEQNALEGAAIRSNLFHSFVSERIPKYIAKYEKQTGDLKTIPYLTTPSGPIYSPPELITHARSYWGSVFQSPEFGPFTPPDSSAARGLLKKYKGSRLPRNLYDTLDAPISYEELSQVVRNLPKYRANGPDGLPYEFYAHPMVWDKLGHFLHLVMVSSCTLGTLPQSMSNCDVVLLFKKAGRDCISNYRPISVLNCDYRIFARLLVLRLNPVAQYLVKPDQTGFIKGRLISDNGMLLQSLIEFAEWDESQIQGAMIFLDFEKAFDSVQWSWIIQTLTARGLPPSFIHMIRLFYTSPHASVIVNGFRAPSFVVGRGVRQGCPLSPLLFAIILEPLLDAIREHPSFKGIKIPFSSKSVKISCFADDSTPLILDENDFNILYQILDTFANASGLRLNKDKVKGLWLSKTAIPPPSLINRCEWLKRGVIERVLGYRLGINVAITDQHQHVIDKIRSRLQLFSARAFSLSARVTCLKMCIHSILWYFAFVTPTTPEMITTLNRWCYNFLWRKPFTPLTLDKPLSGKVNRKTIALPRHLGGLNYQDINVQLSALRAKWLRLFLNHHHKALWKEVVLSRLFAAASPWLPRDPQIILAPFTNFARIPTYLIPVIQQVPSLSIRRTLPLLPHELIDTPLFFNPRIPRFEGSRLSPIAQYRPWADAGFITVGSLFDDSGDPLSFLACLSKLSPSPLLISATRIVKFQAQHQSLLAAIPPEWLSQIPSAKIDFMYLRPDINVAAVSTFQLPFAQQPTALISLSSSSVRESLIKQSIPRSKISYLQYWERFFPLCTSLPWSKIWLSVKSKVLSFKHQEFLWLLSHAALYVGDNPKAKSIVRQRGLSPIVCLHCGDPETLPHALYDCPALTLYWSWVYNFSLTFLRYTPPPPDFRRHILLGDFMLHNVPVGIHYDTWLILRATSLFTVWKLRNKLAYDAYFTEPVTPYLLFSTFTTLLAFYANSQYAALDFALTPHSSNDFHMRWLPGLLTVYSNHAIKVSAKPPSLVFAPKPVCSCQPLPALPPTPELHDDDFLPLPPPPRPCHICGAPPPFYPP